MIWTQEANAECAKYMKSKAFYINAQGENVRIMQYEVPQTMYDLTREPRKDAKTLNADIAKIFYERPADDYTFDFISDNIAYIIRNGNRIRKYAQYDKLTIPAKVFGNDKPIETTVGRVIVYKVMVEGLGLDKFVKFEELNMPVTKKLYEKFEGKVTNLLLKDQIDTDLFVKYINHRDWLGLQIHGLVTISFTEKTCKTPANVKKLREKLLAENKEALEAGDIVVANKIEDELIKATLEEIKDDVGYDMYASGARGTTSNHLKNMFVMRGGVNNPNTGRYDIMTSSFTDGISKSDFTAAANSAVVGSYAKSCASADSGYLAKQLMAAMQGEVIGDEGSDCGTNLTLDVTITPAIKGNFINRYINENGKLTLMTPDDIGKYVGKTVKMYSPMYCRNLPNGCMCEKCSGIQTSKFPGLDSNRLATTLVNLGMKKFHVTNIEFYDLKPDGMLVLGNGENYFTMKDGKIITTKPIDFLVPDFHYENNLIEEQGARMRLFGTVSVRLGANTYDTLNIPAWHQYNVYTATTETIEIPGMGVSKCRVFHYDAGYEVCLTKIVKDSDNAYLYLRQIIYGKLPTTIPYEKVLSFWMKNQEINSVDFKVSSLIYETVLSAAYRYKKDPTRKYGVIKAAHPDEVGSFDYEMAGFRRICQLSSTFAGITFESFDDMTTSAINKATSGAAEAYSPLEQLFKL